MIKKVFHNSDFYTRLKVDCLLSLSYITIHFSLPTREFPSISKTHKQTRYTARSFELQHCPPSRTAADSAAQPCAEVPPGVLRSRSLLLAKESVRGARTQLGSQHGGVEAEAALEARPLPRTDEHVSKVTLDLRTGSACTGGTPFKKKKKKLQGLGAGRRGGGSAYRFECFSLLVSWCSHERNTV